MAKKGKSIGIKSRKDIDAVARDLKKRMEKFTKSVIK